VASVLALAPGPASASPNTELLPASAGKGYTSLSPARLLDTRPGTATADGQFIGGGAVEHFLDLPVAGRGGVPATGAIAVALNVTVTAPTAASFLTAWPTGEAQPNASNLNFVPNQTIANSVIVKLGADGKVSFFNETGTTHLIVDVVGWFATGADYTPRVPARILDTRPDGTTIDGQGRSETLIPGLIALQVTDRAGVPSTATAVVLNVTVVAPTENSFATVWPHGSATPNASNLNFEVGRNVANLAVAAIGTEGKVDIQYAAGKAYVLADVVGWFGTEGDYTAVQPARLLDTRSPNATIDGESSGTGAVGRGGIIDVQVAGRGGVPLAGVDAVVVNVTATQPTSGSFVTVWPNDGAGPPNASTLNVVAGRTVPNLAVVKLGVDGDISLFNEQGSTHLIVDVVGWFPSSLDFSATSLTPGVVNTVFSQSFGAVHATGGVAFGFIDTAPGLSGGASGTVTGTPTVAGTYSTLALVADAGGAVAARLMPHHIFSAGDGFTPVATTTVVDTFTAPGPVPNGSAQNLVAGGVGGVPLDAEAVVVNVVAKSPTTAFLTFGAGGNLASVLMPPDTEVTNVVVQPLGASGDFTVNNFSPVDYRVEVLGYFGSGSHYTQLTPTRVADSRSGGGIAGAVAPGATVDVATGLPGGATSAILSIITTGSADGGSLDVVPQGAAPQAPTTMDFGSTDKAQTVVVPVNAGSISIRNRAGGTATHVIVDLVGYFAP
jgi:hypothetical protein